MNYFPTNGAFRAARSLYSLGFKNSHLYNG